MDRRLFWCFLLVPVFGLLGLSTPQVEIAENRIPPPTYGAVYDVPQPSIRMLCIKHSREHMADGDADLAIKAVKNAAAKGLPIKVVGNHFVDGRLVAGFPDNADFVQRIYDAETLTQYVNQYIKEGATPGDTLIIFTIGHGFPSGGLQNIGQRKDVQKVLAEAAERHNQKIFWWQLSCHASASLPSIDTLTPRQQELVTMFASSAASETSAAYVQGNIMAKIFNAMADKSSSLDANGDGKITAAELRSFMNTINGAYGSRVHAKSPDYVVFGRGGMPVLPIVDRNGPQGRYPDDYVFPPR